RRPQGGGGERLVRRAPVGDGGRLQDLRRELHRRGAAQPHRRGGAGDGGGGAESLGMARIRYDAAVATFIALFAVGVAGYTAYIQRQQVRAQVWPVLELVTSNEPALQIAVSNKGVGPALIRNVVVTTDGKVATKWREVMENLLGPGKYSF